MLTTKKQIIYVYLVHRLIDILFYIVKVITIPLFFAVYIHFVTTLSDPQFTGTVEALHLIPAMIWLVGATCKRLVREIYSGTMSLNIFEPSLYGVLWIISFSVTSNYNQNQLLNTLSNTLLIFIAAWFIHCCNKPLYDKIMTESLVDDPNNWITEYNLLHSTKINYKKIDMLSKTVIKEPLQSFISVIGYDDMRHSTSRYTYTRQTLILGIQTRYLDIIKLGTFSISDREQEPLDVRRLYKRMVKHEKAKNKICHTRRKGRKLRH